MPAHRSNSTSSSHRPRLTALSWLLIAAIAYVVVLLGLMLKNLGSRIADESASFQTVAAQSDQQLRTWIMVLGAALVLILGFMLYFQVQNRRERLIEESKDEFVSLASHQLRAPLTSMRLFAEMLLGEQVGKLNAKQREYVQIIASSTERMADLVNSFLNISLLELGQLKFKSQEMHLEDLVETVVDQLSPLAKQGHLKLEFIKPALPPVRVEPNLYGQIVNNLLTNAINYTPSGGQIKLKLSRAETGYQLDVTDNGIGVPDSAHGKLFKRFYRADNAKRVTSDGTGLGLYLIQKILDGLGGDIWYDSIEGQGASFHVIIPLAGMHADNRGRRTL
ncbi:MAG: HAMP domain-containing sensor histidine kinase [Candidatus Saccharimonadales bacterium]